jgi:hypothetical protein
MIDLLALQESWCRETGAGDSGLSGMPVGQCAVTALLVQDLLGGEIVRAEIARYDLRDDGSCAVESHYWNRIPGMGDIDLTRAQYPSAEQCPHPAPVIPPGDAVPRSRLMEGERAVRARTPERYALLKQRYEARARSC